jgi:hypothetical protein
VSRRIKAPLRVRIARWLMRDEGAQPSCEPARDPFGEDESVEQNEIKMFIKPAMNGRIVTMQQFRQIGTSGLKSNWHQTIYLVPDGEDLIKAITVLLVSSNLGK